MNAPISISIFNIRFNSRNTKPEAPHNRYPPGFLPWEIFTAAPFIERIKKKNARTGTWLHVGELEFVVVALT